MVAFGRLVNHDPKSRRFAANTIPQPRTVTWKHYAPVLEQGELSSCTGHALAQCLNTTKHRWSRPNQDYLGVEEAVQLYSVATNYDDFDGAYPPDDTGSSGLSVCKAGKNLGYLSEYRHAFSFDDAIAAIGLGPAIVGVNWYSQMMLVDADGFISVDGGIQGGHEVMVLGVNVDFQTVTIVNSWGPQWGRNGRAKIRWTDFQRLLDEDGDFTVPVGLTSPFGAVTGGATPL